MKLGELIKEFVNVVEADGGAEPENAQVFEVKLKRWAIGGLPDKMEGSNIPSEYNNGRRAGHNACIDQAKENINKGTKWSPEPKQPKQVT